MFHALIVRILGLAMSALAALAARFYWARFI